MTEEERIAYSYAVAECEKVVEEFAVDYVTKWGGTDAAKAEGWAILQAAAAIRKILLPGEVVANGDMTRSDSCRS